MTMLLEGWHAQYGARAKHRLRDDTHYLCGLNTWGRPILMGYDEQPECKTCLRLENRYLPFDAKEE